MSEKPDDSLGREMKQFIRDETEANWHVLAATRPS